ncbi:hypothetical protein [Bosea sp. (in: a-proteobacteria)]|uniref:hypothetical protein n=1 Tax=Bosea sp. (in: a-proteobacteria) TaxID=1871050 RepID=UPI003B3A0306
MSSIKFAAVLLVAGALGGCITTEDLRAADEAQCRSYGFRAPSEAFSNCLMQLDLDRAAARRARFDRFDDGFYGPRWYGWRRW